MSIKFSRYGVSYVRIGLTNDIKLINGHKKSISFMSLVQHKRYCEM